MKNQFRFPFSLGGRFKSPISQFTKRSFSSTASPPSSASSSTAGQASSASSTTSQQLPQLSKEQLSKIILQRTNERAALIKETAQNLPTDYSLSGLNYSLPKYLAQRRLRLLVINSAMGLGFAAFICWVYMYSIWAVKQDDLDDDFIAEIERIQKKTSVNVQ